MANDITRGVLGQTINGAVDYFYPKTEADLVEYENGVNVKDKIKELEDKIKELEAAMQNLWFKFLNKLVNHFI